jgi:hypothetical protein
MLPFGLGAAPAFGGAGAGRVLQQEVRGVGRLSQTLRDEGPGEIDLTHFQVCRECKTPQFGAGE